MKITCPNCGFTREVSEEKIPKNAQIATCPKCSHKFKFREVEKNFVLEEKSGAGFSDSKEKEEFKQDGEKVPEEISHILTQPQEDEYIPWERIENYGFWNALFATIKKVMFHPSEFFNRLPLSGNLVKAFTFYLIICVIRAVSQVLWGLTGLLRIEDPVKAVLGIGIIGLVSVLFLVLYPLFLACALILGSAINHACLKILGSGKEGFKATFKVVSYSIAPMCLSVVPMMGDFVGALWSLVVTIIGFSSVHNTPVLRVVLAVFLPVIVVVFFLIIILLIKGGIK